MNAPDPWIELARAFPEAAEPLRSPAELQRMADEYQRDAIAGAHDDESAEDLG